jgi:hypothetical protein
LINDEELPIELNGKFNKSIFEGVEKFLQQAYVETGRLKPFNLTSLKFKGYKRETEKTGELSLQRLREVIEDSDRVLENVRRGQSLNQQPQLFNYMT